MGASFVFFFFGALFSQMQTRLTLTVFHSAGHGFIF